MSIWLCLQNTPQIWSLTSHFLPALTAVQSPRLSLDFCSDPLMTENILPPNPTTTMVLFRHKTNEFASNSLKISLPKVVQRPSSPFVTCHCPFLTHFVLLWFLSPSQPPASSPYRVPPSQRLCTGVSFAWNVLPRCWPGLFLYLFQAFV